EIKFSQIQCVKIPAQLKVSLCKPGLEMLETKDHNILIERIPIFIEQYTIMWEKDEVLAPEDFPVIDDDDWKIGNPGSKVLERNFKRIGIDKIWQEIDSKNGTLKGDLDALVTRRNSIAHGDLDSTATSGDVKRYVKSIFELVGRLDGMTYRHLHNVTSVDPDALKSLIESYYSKIDSEFA
ncbi:MAG: MAE_28990/MAE_18760 family HEPN-like nuclease, partial [Candidatus Methanoperedens sp.]